MKKNDKMDKDSEVPSSTKRRNLILGLVLGAAALAMYASIFFRLSGNPLQ